jgi:hypothetical protein
MILGLIIFSSFNGLGIGNQDLFYNCWKMNILRVSQYHEEERLNVVNWNIIVNFRCRSVTNNAY